MRTPLTLTCIALITLLTSLSASAASIYRIKEALPKGTVLTREHLDEVALSRKSNPLIGAAQQQLMQRYVTDLRLRRHLGRALPHDLPKGAYLMREDFTVFGSPENVPSAKNPPRDLQPVLEVDLQTISDRAVAWLDDDVLMVIGLDPDDPKRNSRRGLGRKHLYEWNTRTGEVALFVRDVVGELCVESNEWMWIQVKHESERHFFLAGSVDDLRPIKGRELNYTGKDKPYLHGSYHCARRLPDSELQPIAGAKPRPVVYPLREQDGYLVIPSRIGESRIRSRRFHYQRPGEPPLILPIIASDVRAYLIRYYGFADGYFLENSERSNRDADYARTNCSTSWWMRPTGELSPLCIPWGNWNYIKPFRDGLVLGRLPFYMPSDGLHVQREGRLVQIYHGPIAGLEVSPNGCRIAFVTRTVSRPLSSPLRQRGPWLPKVMELCEPDEEPILETQS